MNIRGDRRGIAAAAGPARSTGGTDITRRGGRATKAVIHLLVGLFAVAMCLNLAAAATSAQPVPSLAAGSAATLPPWPVLSQGNNSSSPPVTVRSLQYLLNAHGARLDVDGIFGPRTDTAVRAFQRAHGLVVDGIVGSRTWSSVIVTARRGSVGPAVSAVQDQANFRNLRGDGPPTLNVDGVFGAKTDAWVRAFQSGMSLQMPFAVDGIVGPMTWQALITESLSG